VSVTPPKNDKARKAWLVSLNDGDEVAWIAGGSGSRRVTIMRARDTFVGRDCHFTIATGKGKTGNWRSTEGWIVPLDTVRQEVRATEARERLERVKWQFWQKQATDEQVLACAAVMWPKEFGGKS
jgi:hypothetical protein